MRATRKPAGKVAGVTKARSATTTKVATGRVATATAKPGRAVEALSELRRETRLLSEKADRLLERLS